MRRSAALTAAAALCAAIAVAACGTPIKSASTGSKSKGAAACAKSNLPLVHKGVLTVATDSPAYPP